MTNRTSRTAAIAALFGTLGVATVALVTTPTLAANSPSCTHAALSPYVQEVRVSSASLITDLTKYGGSPSAVSTISITLKSGARVGFTFSSGHFTLRGSGIPAACKSLTSSDDWEF
jgi:hypothetical protein